MADTTQGDAMSRLIQLQAGKQDIRLAWTGHGGMDLSTLLQAHAVKARMAKHLWTAIQELMTMARDLPEPMQAKIAATILHAHALTELENETKAPKQAAGA